MIEFSLRYDSLVPVETLSAESLSSHPYQNLDPGSYDRDESRCTHYITYRPCIFLPEYTLLAALDDIRCLRSPLSKV